MRKFGQVETAIWQNWKFHELSDDEKILWLYLIACPHGNALGCFVLPIGYVAADLQWDSKRASKALSKLCARGRIERDERSALTRVVGWFGHNRIENANVAKGIIVTMRSLPLCGVLSNAIKHLLSDGGQFVEQMRQPFETAFEDLLKSFEPPEPDKEPDKEPEEDANASFVGSDADDESGLPNGQSKRLDLEACRGVWNQICGEVGLPRCETLNEDRRKSLRARLKEPLFREDPIERWRIYCRKIALEVGPDPGWSTGRPTFDWAIKPATPAKVHEGAYRKPATQSRPPPDPFTL